MRIMVFGSLRRDALAAVLLAALASIAIDASAAEPARLNFRPPSRAALLPLPADESPIGRTAADPTPAAPPDAPVDRGALLTGTVVPVFELESAGADNSPAELAPAQSAQNASAESLFAEAFRQSQRAELQSDYGQIITLVERGLRQRDARAHADYAKRLLAWAHNRRGECRALAGDAAEAIADFERACALDARCWRALHNRAVSRAQEGEYPEALADLDAVLQQKPEFVDAWFNRGEVYYEMGKYEAAIENYDQALRLRPSDADALNSRGYCHFRLGRAGTALADFSQAIEARPDFALVYLNRGDARLARGEYDRAARDYRTAIRIEPENPRGYQSAAWLMATCPDARFRDATLALEAARKAIELAGDADPRFAETLAAALANAGQFEEAAGLQERVERATAIDAPKRHARSQAVLALYQTNKPYRLDSGSAETRR